MSFFSVKDSNQNISNISKTQELSGLEWTLLANFTSAPQHQQWNAQVNDELLSSGLIFGGCYGVKFLPSEQNNAIAWKYSTQKLSKIFDEHKV